MYNYAYNRPGISVWYGVLPPKDTRPVFSTLNLSRSEDFNRAEIVELPPPPGYTNSAERTE
jgi:hypothetical protein